MDRDKHLKQRLLQMDSYSQHLVSLIPPQNYKSQTADEEEETTDFEDDAGLLAKVLKKSSHIKTISKKDRKVIKPMKKESKHKQQEEKSQPADSKGIKKLNKKRLMRREDIVEIIKKQKADDSGVETIGSVDLEDSKDPVARNDNVVRESSRLEVLGDGEDNVDVTKSVSVGLDSFEEGKDVNAVKKEHKTKQFKVPEEGKQGKDKKIESVPTENEKVNFGGEISKSKKKRQKRESETGLGDSSVDDIMQKSDVLSEKKLNKHEQKEKQDTLPVEGEQSGEVEEKVIVASDKLKVSSTNKKKKKEADQEREAEKESKMEVVPLEEKTSELKTKKKKKKKENIEDKNDSEDGGKKVDEGGEEEMVLDLGDFRMSDLGGTTGEEDEEKEEAGDGTKVRSSNKQENQDFLELREKVRSKIKAFELQRKAKDGNEKKNRQKKLKAKLKKMKKEKKKKEALAAKKSLKKQEEGRDSTQNAKGEKENDKVKEEQKGENKLQFSQLEFDSGTVTGKKKKSKKTKNMIENQTGKNYKVLLDKVEKKKEKYEKLKAVDPDLAVDWLSQEKWRKAVLKAQGEKIKDDPELLKKSLKRTEKRKKRSRQKMKEMQERVLKDKEERQQKRNRNLKEKQQQRKAKKTKRLQKKGKLLLADRDKI